MDWVNPFAEGPVPPAAKPDTGWVNPFQAAAGPTPAADTGWKNPFEDTTTPSQSEADPGFLSGAWSKLKQFGEGAVKQGADIAHDIVAPTSPVSGLARAALPLPLAYGVENPGKIADLAKGMVMGPVNAIRHAPDLLKGGSAAGGEAVDLAMQVGLPLLGMREHFKGKPVPEEVPPHVQDVPGVSGPGHPDAVQPPPFDDGRRTWVNPESSPPPGMAERRLKQVKILEERRGPEGNKGSRWETDATLDQSPPAEAPAAPPSVPPSSPASPSVIGTVAKSGLLGENIQMAMETAERSDQPPVGTLPRNLPEPAPREPVGPDADLEENLTKGTIAKFTTDSPGSDAVLREAAARAGERVSEPWEASDDAVREKQPMVGNILARHPKFWDDSDFGAVYSVAKQLQANLKQLYDKLDNPDAHGGISDVNDQIEAAHAQLALMEAKMSKWASIKGRSLNFAKRYANDIGYVGFLNKAREIKLGNPLSDVEDATLRGLVARGNVDGAISFIRSLQEFTKREQLVRGWKDFLISGVGTAVKIGVNTPLFGAFRLIGKPARMILSKALKPLTGVDSDVSLGSLRGDVWKTAVKEGLANLKQIGKGETPNYLSGNEGPFGIMNLEARPFKNVPFLGKPLTLIDNTISRTHLALHQTTFQPVTQSALAELAIGMTRFEHPELKGTAFYEAADHLYKNPTDEMITRAMDRGWQATFLNPNVVSKLMGRAHQFLRSQGRSGALFELGTQYLVPFARISGNLIGRATEMTPVGFVWALSDLNKLWKAVKAGDPALEILDAEHTFTNRLVSAGLGTSALFMTGYFMAKNGHMMGGAPENAMEKRLWDIQGRSPFSITLDKGHTWHNLRMLGPLGLSMMMGAAVQKGTSDPTAETLDQIGGAVVGGASPMMHESFLQNMGDLIDAVSGKPGAGAAAVEDFVGGVVPNVVAEAAKATDSYTRKPGNPWQVIESRVPGLSSNVPPKIGAGGTPLQHETGLSTFAGGNYPNEPTLNIEQNVKAEQVSVLQTQFQSRTNALMKQMRAVASSGGAMNASQRIATINALKEQLQQAGQAYSAAVRTLMER